MRLGIPSCATTPVATYAVAAAQSHLPAGPITVTGQPSHLSERFPVVRQSLFQPRPASGGVVGGPIHHDCAACVMDFNVNRGLAAARRHLHGSHVQRD